MKITYIGKKTTVKDSFKEYAEKKLSKLDKFFGDNPEATVVVTNNNSHDDVVEVTIKSHGMFFRAERATDDRFASLDKAMDILTTQIAKNKERLSRKYREYEDIVAHVPEAAELVDEEDKGVLVKTKKFNVGVMDIDEAILQMNMLGHEFFMFRNGDTGEINVVYKRNDGNFGVLEPVDD